MGWIGVIIYTFLIMDFCIESTKIAYNEGISKVSNSFLGLK